MGHRPGRADDEDGHNGKPGKSVTSSSRDDRARLVWACEFVVDALVDVGGESLARDTVDEVERYAQSRRPWSGDGAEPLDRLTVRLSGLTDRLADLTDGLDNDHPASDRRIVRRTGAAPAAAPSFAPLVTRFDVRSRDPEFAHQALCDMYADFTVRRSGGADGFRFAHTGVIAPAFGLGRVRYGMAAELNVQPSRRSLIVATCSGGRMELRTGRAAIRSGVGEPLLMPSHAGWQVDVDGVTANAVTIDLSVVGQAALSMFGIDPDRLRFTSTRPTSPPATRYWHSVVDHVRRDVLADAGVSANPLVLAEAARSLATALLVAFPHSGLDESERDERAEPAVLRRAVAYVDEHAGEDIGVADIAAAARVGVRGLQHHFRRHLDRTPLEQLRRVRMARAHADLQAADPTRGDTVAAIAARWGFTNPGRFSVQYRKAYGRSPRETLHH